MRSILRRAVVAAGALATALVWSGCTATEQTEYVTGISTQVQVPRDLRAIRLSVTVGGFTQFCQGYRVYDGVVKLPRSLGTFAQKDKTATLTYSIVGYTSNLPDGSEFGLEECTDGAFDVGQRDVRILRRSRQPYIENEVKFLPLPLKYSCYDKEGCNDPGKTCKGGRCVDAGIDPTKLPRFSEDLVDGTGGACFQVSDVGVAPDVRFGCFSPFNTVPPVTVDAATCTYAIPNTPSAPKLLDGVPADRNPFKSTGDGLNVEVTYDGGLNREILDKDPEEGFFVPDPTKPQQFRLAPGLCDMVNGYDTSSPDPNVRPEVAHRITSIRVSAGCQSKSPYQPLCADDMFRAMGTPGGVAPQSEPPAQCKPKELKPAKAALLVVADDSKNAEFFYSGATAGALSLQLVDPAFSRTYANLEFYGSKACGEDHKPTTELLLARTAQTSVAARFDEARAALSGKSYTATTNLDAALRDAYTYLSALPADYYRRAAFVIGNRNFDANGCGTAFASPALAAADAKTKGITTYVALLARDSNPAAPPAGVGSDVIFQQANALAVAGGTPRAFDARGGNQDEARNAFRRVVEDIGTCVYDTTEAIDPSKTELTYSDPIAFPENVPIKIKKNPQCNAEGKTDDGWGVEPLNPKRIRICGKSCDDYRAVLSKAAAYAEIYGKSAIAVPIFRHQAGCEPK